MVRHTATQVVLSGGQSMPKRAKKNEQRGGCMKRNGEKDAEEVSNQILGTVCFLVVLVFAAHESFGVSGAVVASASRDEAITYYRLGPLNSLLSNLHRNHREQIRWARWAVMHSQDPTLRAFASRVMSDQILADQRLLGLAAERRILLQDRSFREGPRPATRPLASEVDSAFLEATLRIQKDSDRNLEESLDQIADESARDFLVAFRAISAQHRTLARSLTKRRHFAESLRL
jgi:hypothetical protein